MNISIRTVEKKDLANECVVLDVANDCDLKHYMIADTTYMAAGQISNRLRNTFWFASKVVKRGDVVVLFTKPGTDSSTPANGVTVHAVYWGLSKQVWNNTGDGILLIHTPSWDGRQIP